MRPVLLLLPLFSIAQVWAAPADLKIPPLKLCATSGGDILAKQRCASSEKQLKLTSLKGQRGPTGPTGARGPAGPLGPTGPRGYSHWDNLPPGQLISNRITGHYSIFSPYYEFTGIRAYFPAPADGLIPNQNVILKFTPGLQAACPDLSACVEAGTLLNSAGKQWLCPGTFELPDAAEGYVCVYPGFVFNVWDLNLWSLSATSFMVEWQIDGQMEGGETYLDASWAYRMPTTATAKSVDVQGDSSLMEAPRERRSGRKPK